MMGSTHGLLGRAMAGDFSLLNGASYITAGDSGSGLTPARVAVELFGDFGAWLLMIMLFMAIVSTGSAEIIAVATIATYDVYCEYLNPELKEERMNARSRYYAFILGKPAGSEISVDELVFGMKTKLPAAEVQTLLKNLADAGFFAANLTEFQKSEIQKKLALRTEPDGQVTSEMVYYAIQSTVLAPASCEAAVMLRVMK